MCPGLVPGWTRCPVPPFFVEHTSATSCTLFVTLFADADITNALYAAKKLAI